MPLVQDIIKTRKWRWLGQTLRKNNEDITKQAQRWNPQGRRRPGRPKNTWRRQLLAELAKENLTMNSIETKASDKREWRNTCSWPMLSSQSKQWLMMMNPDPGGPG